MLPTTKRAISAILDCDLFVTLEHRRLIIEAAERQPIEQRQPRAIPQVVRREEAAKYLGSSARKIDRLSRVGIIRKIKIPGTTRAIGISKASLRALTDRDSLLKYPFE